jgi:hypothetical protein
VAHIQRSNAQRNAAGSSTRLGLTAFTDLTREEFAAAYLGTPMAARNFQLNQQQLGDVSDDAAAADASKLLRKFAVREFASGVHRRGQEQASANKVQHWRYENVTPPAAADWRDAQPPILGPIKDQHVGGAPCGSCWVRCVAQCTDVCGVICVVMSTVMGIMQCCTQQEQTWMGCQLQLYFTCILLSHLCCCMCRLSRRTQSTNKKPQADAAIAAGINK